MKNISIIVAIAENYAIGKDNELLWHISDDLKRFKKLTSGHTVIMGQNTFDSLPNGALPNRKNIVISFNKDLKIPGCIMAYSIEDAIKKCDTNEEVFVIGGGSIYKQFLEIADKIYLTLVHENFEADTFFPKIDSNKWSIIEQDDFIADDKSKYAYSFITYVKK
ncbi:MAG: dihydrofolate reductase [Bacteroidetes bacterium]|nr:MAG: dihydrofolate reductase [Bacteroidota bacterium]